MLNACEATPNGNGPMPAITNHTHTHTHTLIAESWRRLAASSAWSVGANNDSQHMHGRRENNKQSKLNDN